MKDRSTLILTAIITALLSFVLVSYFTMQHNAAPLTATVGNAASDTSGGANRNSNAVMTGENDKTGNPFIDAANQNAQGNAAAAPATEDWFTGAIKIVARLFLAVFFTAILAFRPRRGAPFLQRNLYVAQTQILLSVVAAALMMIVGDNTARAFAIFAAVSLVRFRTNIKDPKEITVLLISLAIGLATGVGRWELAAILCLFVLPLLWFLEYNETEQIFRAMQLTVKTTDTDTTQAALQKIFRRHKLDAEVRQLDPPDAEDPIGCITYLLNMRLSLTTDRLSEEVFRSDEAHIEGVEWHQQKKSAFY